MESPDSITLWLCELKSGEQEAVERLWERYFHRIVGFARHKLKVKNGLIEPEDVALSAFKSLWLGAQHGRFPKLSDRESLWPLLVVLTSRKINEQVAFNARKKRGGGKVSRETDLPAGSEEANPLAQIFKQEPTPDWVVAMSEQCEVLLNRLDDVCRHVASLKLDGYTNEEIASQMQIAPRTVERKLRLIRETWEQVHDSR